MDSWRVVESAGKHLAEMSTTLNLDRSTWVEVRSPNKFATVGMRLNGWRPVGSFALPVFDAHLCAHKSLLGVKRRTQMENRIQDIFFMCVPEILAYGIVFVSRY